MAELEAEVASCLFLSSVQWEVPCVMAEADPLMFPCPSFPVWVFTACSFLLLCCLRLLQIAVLGGQGERAPHMVLGNMKATLSAQVRHWSIWLCSPWEHQSHTPPADVALEVSWALVTSVAYKAL